MLKPATVFVLAALMACDNPLFCSEEQSIVEVVFGDPWDELSYDVYRDAGWDCKDIGAIRNAAGAAIGARYDCSICR